MRESHEGYKCFHVKASACAHGGLITYVDDEFDVSVKRIITNSNIWEGQFLELDHEAFQNKIIIGNVYKPPRDNNNAGNLNAFKAELDPILQELSFTNNEVLICGDYNINLLKLNGETHFSDLYNNHVLYTCTVEPLYKGHPWWWPFKRGDLSSGVK